jgi:hypothetical protein
MTRSARTGEFGSPFQRSRLFACRRPHASDCEEDEAALVSSARVKLTADE